MDEREGRAASVSCSHPESDNHLSLEHGPRTDTSRSIKSSVTKGHPERLSLVRLGRRVEGEPRAGVEREV